MLITVPSAASAKLGELLTPDQRTQFIADVMEQDGYLYFVLQNSGANAIYVESGADASVTDAVSVPAGASISLKTDNLSKVNLIAASGTPNVILTVS